MKAPNVDLLAHHGHRGDQTRLTAVGRPFAHGNDSSDQFVAVEHPTSRPAVWGYQKSLRPYI